MTEKEKMLAGQMYDPADPVLTAERIGARKLLQRFNTTGPDQERKRKAILKQLLGSCGDLVEIEPPLRCDYGSNIEVGENFYANFGCVILDVCKVKMGDNVMLGPYVQIYAATHPTDPQKRLTGREYGRPVTIENNVWIGGGAIICPGVTISDNCTIGAGSVVTRDLPANVVAAGNPCHILRTI